MCVKFIFNLHYFNCIIYCVILFSSRGPRAFEYFQESLRPQYPWLKDRIAELDKSNEKYITNEMEYQVTKSQESCTSFLTVPRQEKVFNIYDNIHKFKSNLQKYLEIG